MTAPAPRRINDPQPGRWLVRCCRRCPDVAARIWLCDHEPGTPENKVDQPYLQGQIGLDLVPPIEVWHRRGLIEITAAEFEHQIEWLKWAERNAPNDPRFTYRKPVTLAAIPIPRFGATP
jgi:hypothetical protein